MATTTSTNPQPESHWLIKIMLSFILLLICSLIGLKLWEIQHVGSSTLFTYEQLKFMPSLVNTLQMGSLLLYKGIAINGLICLMLIGSGPHHTVDMRFSRIMAWLAFTWNSLLLWQMSGNILFSDSSFMTSLTHTLHIYPTAEAFHELCLNTGYLLTWLWLFFPLHETRIRGQFYFHPDIFSFFSLTHGLYGAYLILSVFSSTAFAPMLDTHDWYPTLLWAQQFMFLASVIFLALGGLYLLITLKILSETLESLAFSHWLTFLLGFMLLYVANPISGIHYELPTFATYAVIVGLGLLWFSHIFYCVVSAQNLQKSLTLNYVQFGYLMWVFFVLSMALLGFAAQMTPSEINHETPFWITLSWEFIVGALLLLALFLLGELSQLLSNKPKSTFNIFSAGSYAFSGVGFLIAILAVAISLYYQQKIELASLRRNINIDFHQMSDSLKPLLFAYATGLTLIFIGSVVLFLRSCFLFLSISRLQTPLVDPTLIPEGTTDTDKNITKSKELDHA